jgi:hypothetical protein
VSTVNAIQANWIAEFLKQLDSPASRAPAFTPAAATDTPPTNDGNLRLGIPKLRRDAGTFGALHVDLDLQDPAPERVVAARIIVSRAKDDVGVFLERRDEPQYRVQSVGGGLQNGFSLPDFSVVLTSPARSAKTVQIFEGSLELIVPDRDPDGTVVVDPMVAHLGAPVDSAALRRVGVTLTIFDRQTAAASMNAPGQPGSDYSFRSGLEALSDGDVALVITDPENRLVGIGFASEDNHPLSHFNRGFYNTTDKGPRMEVYGFGSKLPTDAVLVCLLRTAKTSVSAPLKFANLPLPPH